MTGNHKCVASWTWKDPDPEVEDDDGRLTHIFKLVYLPHSRRYIVKKRRRGLQNLHVCDIWVEAPADVAIQSMAGIIHSMSSLIRGTTPPDQ